MCIGEVEDDPRFPAIRDWTDAPEGVPVKASTLNTLARAGIGAISRLENRPVYVDSRDLSELTVFRVQGVPGLGDGWHCISFPYDLTRAIARSNAEAKGDGRVDRTERDRCKRLIFRSVLGLNGAQGRN